MWFQDQFLKPEDIIVRRDAAKALANEWHGRMTTGMATGHGAGLVAIVTFLNAHPGMPAWLLAGIALAAIAFLVGLLLVFMAMASARYFYEVQAAELNDRKEQIEFKAHFAPHLEPNDAAEMLDLKQRNMANVGHLLMRGYETRQRNETWSLRMLVLGVLLAVAAITAGSITSPPKGLSERNEKALTAEAKPVSEKASTVGP